MMAKDDIQTNSYKAQRTLEHEIVLYPPVPYVIKPHDSIPDSPLYLHVFSIFSTTFKHSKSSSTTSTLKSSGKFFDSTIVPLTGAPMAAKDARECAEADLPSLSATPWLVFVSPFTNRRAYIKNLVPDRRSEALVSMLTLFNIG